MSDFTAKLGMLKGSMRTVTPGGSRGVWFRLDELNELLEHRRQIDRLATKASTDTERVGVEALLSEAGNRIEVSRRRLDARQKGLERRRGKVAESQARSLVEARAAWFRAVGRLTAAWSKQRQPEKHVTSVVVGRSEATSRPCLPGPVAEQMKRDAAADASVRSH